MSWLQKLNSFVRMFHIVNFRTVFLYQSIIVFMFSLCDMNIQYFFVLYFFLYCKVFFLLNCFVCYILSLELTVCFVHCILSLQLTVLFCVLFYLWVLYTLYLSIVLFLCIVLFCVQFCLWVFYALFLSIVLFFVLCCLCTEL